MMHIYGIVKNFRDVKLCHFKDILVRWNVYFSEKNDINMTLYFVKILFDLQNIYRADMQPWPWDIDKKKTTLITQCFGDYSIVGIDGFISNIVILEAL